MSTTYPAPPYLGKQRLSLPCSCMTEKACLGIVGIAVGVIVLLLLILLPISFVGLEYYEMGFKRSKSTGSVDVDNVYTVGKHFIGPDREFKIFPADAQFERFVGVTVFSADRLEMEITCTMMYFLRPHQLKALHTNFDVHYRPVLRNNALDALKGAATQFTTREFIRDRERVERQLFKAVKERLGGRCCEKGCDATDTCVEGCLRYSDCLETDYGLFSEVRYFQLGGIGIPDELNQRFLKALVLQEENETEKLRQESQVVRKETQAQVQRIHNDAQEITQNATAQSNLIQSKAKAASVATVEKARSDGLQHLYSEIGITDQKQKAAFDYLRTIRARDNIHLTVNYQQLVSFAGNIPR